MVDIPYFRNHVTVTSSIWLSQTNYASLPQYRPMGNLVITERLGVEIFDFFQYHVTSHVIMM